MKNIEIAAMDREFQVERYWNIIKPRLHILAFCIILALLVGLVKAFTATPTYRAEGILMIAPESENTVIFNDSFRFRRPDLEYFNTQVRILKSRRLAGMVLEEMNDSTFHGISGNSSRLGDPAAAGDLAARIDSFLAQLGVDKLGETRLISVSYTSISPERAAAVVNTLFDEYIAFNLDLKTESTRRASEFITRQMNGLQDSLEQKEAELQDYSKNKDLFYLTNEESAEVGKFSDLSKAYTEAQIDRINKESLYRELKGKKFEDFSGVRDNALINSLKSDYSRLEGDYNKKSQVFKDSYPEMNQLKSQLESVRMRIEEETGNIAEKALKEAKTNYDSAIKKEESMLALLDRQKKEISDSNSNAIYYKSLSIEVENMRDLLNYLDKKGKESMLSSNLEGLEISNIKIIDPADVPRKRISPKRKMILVMALMIGFGIGLVAIFVLDFLDRTVKNPDDIKALLDVPTLGIIPSSSSKSNYHSYLQYLPYKSKGDKMNGGGGARQIEMINFTDPESPLSESYRNIRTSILLSTAGQAPKIITVSSARPAEGKTATVINLAVAFHQLGKKVLLIDGDMRKPRMHKIFRLKNTVGLSSYLVGRSNWTKIVNKTDLPNLFVIPSGPIPPNPVELLDSDVMTALIKETSAPKYDFIFIDSPPFIDIMDPILLGKLSDGMVLVTWSGKTNRNVMAKVAEQVGRFDIRLLGVVLNKVNLKGETFGYSYAYGYGAQEEDHVEEQVKELAGEHEGK